MVRRPTLPPPQLPGARNSGSRKGVDAAHSKGASSNGKAAASVHAGSEGDASNQAHRGSDSRSKSVTSATDTEGQEVVVITTSTAKKTKNPQGLPGEEFDKTAKIQLLARRSSESDEDSDLEEEIVVSTVCQRSKVLFGM